MPSATWRAELPPFSDAFHEAYDLLDLLGEGGMGRVYLARQNKLDREVAIKVLKSLAETETARFEREAKVLAGMAHERILRVFDSGADAGISYLVTERLNCETLERRIRRAPLTLRESLRVCARVADALAYAHGEGVVHRDVKPDNVFLAQDLEVKLGDFGLAREVLGSQITASGTMMGTPEYMSPEQVGAKPVGPASDQFSLGVMLFRLITQVFPFTGENPITIAMARLRIAAPSPRVHCPALPEAVERVVLRALEKLPQDRYETTEELRRELDRLADELGPEGDRVYRPPVRTAGRIKALGAPERVPGRADTADTPHRAARSWPWVLVGLALVLAAGGAAWRLNRQRTPVASVAPAAPDSELPTQAHEAANKLRAVLSKLDPAGRIEELREMERQLRFSGLAPEQRAGFLKPRWLTGFQPRVSALLVPEAWALFHPLRRAYFENPAIPARERLAMANLLEDFEFMCFGLKRLRLPAPFEPSPATDRTAGISSHPAVPLQTGLGFQLARRARGDQLSLVSHPGGGAITRLDMVPVPGGDPLDDRFFVSAVALGEGSEQASVLESMIKVSPKKQLGQTEYRHPKAFELPPRDRLQAVALAAFVSELCPEHRFEIYADSRPDGPFTRRLATFRASAERTAQLWHSVDPDALDGDRVFLRVKFTVLPGLGNHLDDAELHQLSIHWRSRDP